MRAWALRRLLVLVPTFFGITLVTFCLIRLAPGDPLQLSAEPLAGISREALEQQREAMGLNRPLWQQYGVWVRKVVTLDFGRSLQDGRPVREKLAQALPRTLLLSTLALLFGYLFAIPIGLYSAVRQESVAERALTVGVFILYSLPPFWVALMLLFFFCREATLDWFPMQGLTSPHFAQLTVTGKVVDLAWHLVLPVFCLSYGSVAVVSRYLRTGMLEVLRQDYLRTARAKGLSERAVLFRHALRNGFIPVLTLLGLMLPQLLGGSVLVERIFGIPGMGALSLEALLQRDYAVVMGVTTLVAIVTLLSLLASDLLHALADPRVRVGRTG